MTLSLDTFAWVIEYGPYWAAAVGLASLLVVLVFWRLRRSILKTSSQLDQRDLEHREFEQLYAEMVDHASDVIFRLDSQGCIMAMNKAGQKLLNYSLPDLLGKRITELVPPERLSGISQFEGSQEYGSGELVLLDNLQQPINLELRLRRERVDGQTRSIEVIARDVTERRKLEAQYRQTERMQAMGLLAGGVAHDFNNYLTVIVNFADLALESDPSQDVKNMLEEIRKAGLNAATMSRQMLDFSRRQNWVPTALSLNQVISNLSRMLQSGLGKKIELKLQLTTGLPKIIADLGAMEQVLLNLAFNARDAMPEGGTLTVRTLPREGEKRVLLEVSDNGMGMDEATRLRMFEPFFTTKEAGKGSGLGLAAVQRIIMKSAGKISVTSELGKGTTFHIEFPACEPTKTTPVSLAQGSKQHPVN
jgi:PAS domain S-box-containing protein